MLTSVDKEILQTLINLYLKSDGKSIKGEDIAKVMNRNPGTIRNKMIDLRRLNLVKSVPGPYGGYKPTIEAYHSLDLSFQKNNVEVSIYKNNIKLNSIYVSKIEFTNVPDTYECEVIIKVLGSIKDLCLDDVICVGPTPANKLEIKGKIVGKDDVDNILLLSIITIRCIPKTSVYDIIDHNFIYLKPGNSIKEAADLLSINLMDSVPVITEGVAIGVISLSDIVNALAQGKEEESVRNFMSKHLYVVNKNTQISSAIHKMNKYDVNILIVVDDNHTPIGMVTHSNLIEKITNFKEFPILND